MWGATRGSRFIVSVLINFNPRTHVGCDEIKKQLALDDAISIHAPMWGATVKHALKYYIKRISIHAPMWGATFTHKEQSRQQVISIHAPMWGATKKQGRHYSTENFNPRTHVGCDLIPNMTVDICDPFQSTHPCGVRPTKT